MLVIVSTTCPDTIARAPARPADRARIRGRNQLIRKKYAISQAANPTATRQSIATSNSTDPSKDAKAKATTLIISTATSVTARAACICFCAIRPAKSSSKKPTFWPSVQRCKRLRTKGFTFGCTMIAFDADDRPNRIGRAMMKKPTAPNIRPRFCPSKNASGPELIAPSMTRPRI